MHYQFHKRMKRGKGKETDQINPWSRIYPDKNTFTCFSGSSKKANIFSSFSSLDNACNASISESSSIICGFRPYRSYGGRATVRRLLLGFESSSSDRSESGLSSPRFFQTWGTPRSPAKMRNYTSCISKKAHAEKKRGLKYLIP